jgi:peptidoglycan-associated lipoprotein
MKITSQRLLPFLALLLATVPGCSWRAKRRPAPALETVIIKSSTSAAAPVKHKTSLFIDDLEPEEIVEEAEINIFTAISLESETPQMQLTPLDSQTAEEAVMDQQGLKLIYFNFDDYSIRPDQKPALDENIAALKIQMKKQPTERTLVIEGHACNSAGSGSYNMMLSEKRAEAVAKYALEKGLSAANIKIVGRGNEMPIVREGDCEQQAPNRRVRMYLL